MNPKFTAGIHGYEFTAQLHCFDIWGVPVCHGWLLDPHEASEELYAAIGQKTYNEVIESVIRGQEAESALVPLRREIQDLEAVADAVPTDAVPDGSIPAHSAEQGEADQIKLTALREKEKDLQHRATMGTWIDHFLHESCNQLTQYGLHQIHQDLPEGSLGVFFRNNHFSTITKQDGLLYLLVTDLGYANTPQIVWEKLDMINGDTEYVNSTFKTVGQVSQENATFGSSLSPEELLAQSGQKDADYQLAMHLSMTPTEGASGTGAASDLDAREGELVAAATEASLREYHGVAAPSSTQGRNPQIAVGVPLDTRGNSSGTRVVLPPKPGSSSAAPPSDPDHLLAMQLSAGDGGGYDDMASLRLAQQLQAEEDQRAANGARRRPVTTTNARGRAGAQSTSSSSGCAIM